MKKYLSLLMLAITVVTTSGCGKKKQIKPTQVELASQKNNIIPDELLIEKTTRDSKEDYIIAA